MLCMWHRLAHWNCSLVFSCTMRRCRYTGGFQPGPTQMAILNLGTSTPKVLLNQWAMTHLMQFTQWGPKGRPSSTWLSCV